MTAESDVLMPGKAILSEDLKSFSEFTAGLLVFIHRAVEDRPLTPTTSTLGMPLALDHSVMKPGAPVPAMSREPAIMASLMTLPPSSISQLTLSGPRPAFSACFSRSFWSSITMSGR